MELVVMALEAGVREKKSEELHPQLSRLISEGNLLQQCHVERSCARFRYLFFIKV